MVVDRDPTVRAVSSVDIEVRLTIQWFDVTMGAHLCFCCFCQFLAAATCFVFFFFVFVFFFALFASIDAGCLVYLVRCYVSLLFASNRSISMLVSSHRLCCLLLLLCMIFLRLLLVLLLRLLLLLLLLLLCLLTLLLFLDMSIYTIILIIYEYTIVEMWTHNL